MREDGAKTGPDGRSRMMIFVNLNLEIIGFVWLTPVIKSLYHVLKWIHYNLRWTRTHKQSPNSETACRKTEFNDLSHSILGHSSLLSSFDWDLEAFVYTRLSEGPTTVFQSGWGLTFDWPIAELDSFLFLAVLLEICCTPELRLSFSCQIDSINIWL